MRCPNCNESHHEPAARFCHVCGVSLCAIIDNRCPTCGIEIVGAHLDDCSVESRIEEDQYPPASPSDAPRGVLAINLGLPSGTKWASCNIGATRPEAFGDYYAWGEVSAKSVYDWSTYTHCDGTIESCHNIGSDICGTQHDAAHVKWGRKWQIPISDQIKELIDNCRYEWTQFNGVNGGRFTGPNGNSIFLPAAGYRDDSSLINTTGCIDVSYFAEYLSGSQISPFIEYAFCLQINDCGAEWRNTARCNGNVIRAVEKP